MEFIHRPPSGNSYDDFQEFQSQVQTEIAEMALDCQLKSTAIDFANAIRKHKYSYHFRWLGLPIIQYPQDIMAMQEIIWEVKPDLIIETGIARGGSIIFYASMLELLGGKGKVIGIDIDIREHNRKNIERHPMYKNIYMIQESSTSGTVIEKINNYIKENKCQTILVALDSNHTHEHVLEELKLYSQFVTRDSYLVVFDTSIEDVDESFIGNRPWGKGNNPKTAVFEFLKTNDRFIVDRTIESKLVITAIPSGCLKCIK